MTVFNWNQAAGGSFNTTTDWTPNGTPGSSDTANLVALSGSAYTVTSSQSNSVSILTTAANATLDITNGTFTDSAGTGSGANAGAIDVGNNTYFVIGGTFDNTGSVNLQSGNNDTRLRIGSSTTLSGGGTITLSNNTNNRIDATVAGLTLTNTNNTIEGAGQLGFVSLGGSAAMSFVNQASGIVDANDSNTLDIDFGSTAVSNAGLLEATGSGGLTIYHSKVVDTATGIIEANGGNVLLQTADIVGGLLETTGTSVIETVDRGSVLDGTTAAKPLLLGTLDIVNNTYLYIQGTIDLSKKVGKITETGTIELSSVNNDTELVVTAKNASLGTGGFVTMSDNSNNAITGTVTTTGTGSKTKYKISKLANSATISGAGTIGTNLTLTNSGTIDATGSNALIIDTGNSNVANSNVVTNNKLIEATNPNALASTGGLRIAYTIVAGAKSVIEANGAATHVDLQSATIRGGKLVTANGGVIQAIDRGSLLDGTTSAGQVNNTGTVNILNNQYLAIAGTINNTGSINVQSVNNDTELDIAAAGATLTGGGTVTLSNNTNNYIYTYATATTTLTNVNNTIEGSGQIVDGTRIVLDNEASGTIDADTSSPLTINTGTNVVTNSGLLEATAGGTLVILSTTINNSTGGVIQATGGTVNLESADIIGGTLKSASGGTFQSVDRGSEFNGTSSTINNQATVNILNNQFLAIAGTINNTGSINLQSVNNDTELDIAAGGATLTGGGTVTLSNNTNNYFYTYASAATTLTNVNNTIEGSGQIGDGSNLVINNEASGTIDNNTTDSLTIDTGSNVFTNSGLLETTAGGTLVILSTTVNGSTGGVIEANGATVNLESADIIGGTLKSPSGTFQSVDRGSEFNGTSSTVDNQATVNILNNQFLAIAGTINNTGSINVQSVNNDTELDIATGGATLTGGGTVTLSNNSNNYIYTYASSATTLTNGNTIEGSGQIGEGSQLVINNQGSGIIDANTSTGLVINTGGGNVTNAGELEATSGGTLTIDQAVSNTGTIVANGGNLSISGAVTGAGIASVTGGSDLTFGSTVSNTVNFTGTSGTLTLDDSQGFTGTINLSPGNTGNIVDARDINFADLTTKSYSSTGSNAGTLTLKDSLGDTATLKITGGTYTINSFTFKQDSGSGTEFFDPPSAGKFLQAMASFGATSGSGTQSKPTQLAAQQHLLASPHA